jgi:hypothetical protein
MKVIEISHGQVLIGTEECDMIGAIAPISEGFWVAISHPNDRGILVDHDGWKAFVDLVKSIDSYVEENYGQVRS